MSVAAISQVWKSSKAKGGPLLVLLAIADYAHDDGRNAWPTINTLAAKSRMTTRAIRFILKQLEATGEITIEPNVDRKEVQGGYVPKTFIHVRCVKGKDVPPEGKDFPRREKISRSASEKISQTVKTATPIVQDFSLNSEKTRIALKEDPSSDPSVKQERGADAPAFTLIPGEATDAAQGDVEHGLRVRFDRLTAIYPRGAAFDRAWRVFLSLKPTDAQVDQMVAAVEHQKRTVWGGCEPRFIPHLWRWLKDRRWTDATDDVAPVSQTELKEAGRYRRRVYVGRCPHGPACSTTDECLKQIALALRTRSQTERAG